MNKPDNSRIDISASGTSITGPDAMLLYKAISLKSALNMYVRSKMLMTRGLTPTLMLKIASDITKKPYKRGQYDAAIADLTVWIETMKAAIPTTVNGVEQ